MKLKIIKLFNSMKSVVTSTYVLVLIITLILFLFVDKIPLGIIKNVLTVFLLIVEFSCLILEAFSDLSKKHFKPTFYIMYADIFAILIFLIVMYLDYDNLGYLGNITKFLTYIIVLKVTRHSDMVKIGAII